MGSLGDGFGLKFFDEMGVSFIVCSQTLFAPCAFNSDCYIDLSLNSSLKYIRGFFIWLTLTFEDSFRDIRLHF
uniref:CSON008455 protein n=1 Tax=Culicoides sonorensis TaxID=179676 RepID=A0A336K2Y9_CULSO